MAFCIAVRGEYTFSNAVSMALSLYRASRRARCSRKAASPGAAVPSAFEPPVVTRDRDVGGGGGGGGGDRGFPWWLCCRPSGSLSAADGGDGLRVLSLSERTTVVALWVSLGEG